MQRGLAMLALLVCAAAPVVAWRVAQPVPAPGGACRGITAPAQPGTGMVHLRGGVFAMGAGGVRPDDAPVRNVRVEAFWVDKTDVTNAQFGRFVAATGYRTLAERGLDEARWPGRSAAERAPASLVFMGAAAAADLHDPGTWWRIVPGADWRHPAGPGSSIDGRAALPVVHVAYEDALAYAQWLGHDLPTEAEWEYAARGGVDGARFVWGDQERPDGSVMANTWQGGFPVVDTAQDGYRAQASPVGCFPPNGFGLYDMAGNVWQWTRTPAGGAEGGHVIKGGSFLCAPNYCFGYRPAARQAGPPDTGASHIGFRTVLRG